MRTQNTALCGRALVFSDPHGKRRRMETVTFEGKTYEIDDQGFLQDWRVWDERFAEGGAPRAGITDGLTEEHWRVIRHIRAQFQKTGECPLVFATCRELGLRLKELEALFPKGYLRGACRLAGISYRDRFVDYFGEPSRIGVPMPGGVPVVVAPLSPVHPFVPTFGKVYRIDVLGFLVDPADWDPEYAAHRAREMNIPRLSEQHWQILDYLRKTFEATGSVPTVIQCCKDNDLELEELEDLFPKGYHRCAVKLAGLCVRPGR